MKDHLSYKEVTVSDIPQLKELAISSYSQFLPELTAENQDAMLKSLNGDEKYKQLFEQSTTIICFHGSEAIGVAYFVPHGNPTEVFDTAWSYIRMVSVHPDYEGMGIATHLIQRCIEQAKITGEKKIGLHTSEMMNAARHIYQKAGFNQVRELDLHYGKRY